jgi:hypothetical protein
MSNLSDFIQLFTGTFSEKITANAGIALSSGSINNQTGTTYTLVAADNGEFVVCDNAAAITVTVPAGLPLGFSCSIIQKGAGQVTLSASGTTLRLVASQNKTAAQYAVMTLLSHVANEFIVGGNVSA